MLINKPYIDLLLLNFRDIFPDDLNRTGSMIEPIERNRTIEIRLRSIWFDWFGRRTRSIEIVWIFISVNLITKIFHFLQVQTTHTTELSKSSRKSRKLI